MLTLKHHLLFGHKKTPVGETGVRYLPARQILALFFTLMLFNYFYVKFGVPD